MGEFWQRKGLVWLRSQKAHETTMCGRRGRAGAVEMTGVRLAHGGGNTDLEDSCQCCHSPRISSL